MIYVIEAVGCGRFKVGYTDKSLDGRFKALATACPVDLRIVAVQRDGTRFVEHLMHRRMQEFRVRLEWFSENEYLRSWINKHAYTTPDAYRITFTAPRVDEWWLGVDKVDIIEAATAYGIIQGGGAL